MLKIVKLYFNSPVMSIYNLDYESLGRRCLLRCYGHHAE